MKKKIIIIILTLFIGFLVLKGKEYYNDRYVEDSIYYVYVPQSQSIEIEDLKDSSGNVVDKGKNYSFIGLNEKGEKKKLEFSYSTEDSKKLIQPGSYLKISSSKTIVLGQEVILESQVPVQIFDEILTLSD